MMNRSYVNALIGVALLACGNPRMQSADPMENGLGRAMTDGLLDDWSPTGSAGDNGGSGLDGRSCLDAAPDAILGIATRDNLLLAVRGGGVLEPLHTFAPSLNDISALMTGDFVGAVHVGQDGTGEIVLLRNGELIAQHTTEIHSWTHAAALGADGTFVVHWDNRSLLVDGEGLRMLPPDVIALDVPDAEGFVPSTHEGPGATEPTHGFAHADGGDFRPLSHGSQYVSTHYSDGRFVYIGDDNRVVVEGPGGGDVVYDSSGTAGALGLHQSGHWALVTRDDRPVLRVDLRTLETLVINAAALGADAAPTIQFMGDFALGLAQPDPNYELKPLWRLDLTTGSADLGAARWSHPTLEQLDAAYCGAATQLLADGRLGVATRDAYFGYFQLEDAAAGGAYTTVGIPVQAPSLMAASQRGRWLILNYDSADNTYCPHHEYEPPPADAVPHEPPNGLQLIDALGELPTLSFEHESGRWYAPPSIAFDRNERCAAVYELGRWTLYDLADHTHVDLGELADVQLN